MQNINRMHTQPNTFFPRTNRVHETRGLTSLPAGKMVPLAAIPLLREDAIRSGRYRVGFEMQETVELLMNDVNVRVMAYLVPTLAFERFQGSMDILNRSYMGQPPMDGETVIPFIENDEVVDGSGDVLPFYQYLGAHAADDDLVNTAYLEAYNLIWNFRAKNRSPDIELRQRLAGSLAPAFWLHDTFGHIVPDFDQAKIDGEVALNVTGFSQAAPVSSSGPLRFGTDASGMRDVRLAVVGETGSRVVSYETPNATGDVTAVEGLQADLTELANELSGGGIRLSLSNIELARKTQALARIRERYTGIDDEYVLDMLMSGLSIPDQALKQPILLADRRTKFGMGKRYATDSTDLTASVVNGVAMVDFGLRVPKIATGGVVMIVAEITPEQLFERQMDPYLHAQEVADFPDAMRDGPDPEKVTVVPNRYVDIDHDSADDVFGYAPLNHQWVRRAPNIGGKFYRPKVDASFDEDRQRIWAVETANPTLAEDFYLCTQMHTKPFVVQDSDPFEAVTVGRSIINGLTQFGALLIEGSDDYEKVLEKVDQTRIDQGDAEESEE